MIAKDRIQRQSFFWNKYLNWYRNRRDTMMNSTSGNIFSSFKKIFNPGSANPTNDNFNRTSTFCVTASLPTREVSHWVIIPKTATTEFFVCLFLIDWHCFYLINDVRPKSFKVFSTAAWFGAFRTWTFGGGTGMGGRTFVKWVV